MNLPETPTKEVFYPEGGIRTRVSMFINKAACKQFILDYANQTRHHKFSRVDSEIFAELNAVIRKHCKQIVARQPSMGRTIR